MQTLLPYHLSKKFHYRCIKTPSLNVQITWKRCTITTRHEILHMEVLIHHFWVFVNKISKNISYTTHNENYNMNAPTYHVLGICVKQLAKSAVATPFMKIAIWLHQNTMFGYKQKNAKSTPLLAVMTQMQ